ncbi:MAG: GNAT family N-acetyltransferase [Firmicutes bacterium]|nr:GNAT family N-acetyltransferase [Bacillota bacterium]
MSRLGMSRLAAEPGSAQPGPAAGNPSLAAASGLEVVQVERVGPGAAALVHRLVQRAFAEYRHHPLFPQPVPALVETLEETRSDLKRPDVTALVAWKGAEPVGTLRYRQRPAAGVPTGGGGGEDQESGAKDGPRGSGLWSGSSLWSLHGPSVSVHRFGVLPEWRHCGAGGALLDAAEVAARSLGAAGMWLWTPEVLIPVLRFYQARGFVPVRREQGYGVWRLLMWKALR